MALPDNELSLQVISSQFLGGRRLSTTFLRDFETGGAELNFPAAGHLVQIWEATVEQGAHIVISNEKGFRTTYYSDFNITEVSLTFDQNMRPAIALVADSQAKLIWHDPVVNAEVVTLLDSDVRNPRVSLDDKRFTQMGTNDIILSYLRGANLYHRRQRDRFTVEYLLAENIVPDGSWYLRRTGMNVVNRFQFELFRDFGQEEIIADMLTNAAATTTEGLNTPGAAASIIFDFGSSTLYAPDSNQEN